MTKTAANPFAGFDFSAVQPFGFSTEHLDALTDRQRHMLEAVVEVNRAAIEGYQTIMVRQVELMNDAIENVAKSVNEVLSQPEPGEMAAKQIAFMRDAFDTSYQNVRELTELANETNAGAFRTFQERMAEAMQPPGAKPVPKPAPAKTAAK